MPDLAYDATLNAANRRKAKLEISFDPTIATPVYVRVPAAGKISGYKPTTNVNRTPLFVDASGKASDAVTVTTSGGTMNFSTISPPSNAVIKSMFNKAKPSDPQNQQVLARYTDGNALPWSIQGVLTYQGEDGDGPNDTTMYSWSIEVIAADVTLPV